MARVACRAVANRPVVVGFADRVALLAAAGHGGSAFESDEWMRGPFYPARLIRFGEGDLFGRERLFSAHGGPGNSGVAAVEKFLIDLFVASTAIAGRDVARGDDETIVVFGFLSLGGLVAVEAVDAALGVLAHFVFVNDGVLGARVAVGALASGADELGARLFGFRFGARAINEEGSDNHRESDGDSDEDVTKGHDHPPI